jgi:hypothetical protein
MTAGGEGDCASGAQRTDGRWQTALARDCRGV